MLTYLIMRHQKQKKSHSLISSPISFISQAGKSLSIGCKHRGKTLWGHSEKAAVPKPGREFSPEPKFAGTLTVDF